MSESAAKKHSRYTLLLEAFAIDVLQAAGSIQAAALFLGINFSRGALSLSFSPYSAKYCGIYCY